MMSLRGEWEDQPAYGKFHFPLVYVCSQQHVGFKVNGFDEYFGFRKLWSRKRDGFRKLWSRNRDRFRILWVKCHCLMIFFAMWI